MAQGELRIQKLMRTWQAETGQDSTGALAQKANASKRQLSPATSKAASKMVSKILKIKELVPKKGNCP
jgi:hypothetical protein